MQTADELRRVLGQFGIWMPPPARTGLDSEEYAREIEAAGFTSAWFPGMNSVGDLRSVEPMLAATDRLVLGTGIASVWTWTPADLAREANRLATAYPGRFILGLGVSHAPGVEATGQAYVKPYSKMVQFLDELPAVTAPVVLAALGPKMLQLAATRARGAHPYLVTPDHTRRAREVLGRGPLLLPEQTVLLTDDADQARAVGTDWLRAYLALPNYANNLLRSGFTENDLDSVSDRLFDAIVAWGDEDAIVRRVDEHKQAGADHVCVQVLTADPREFPREHWRRLAGALL